MYVNCEEIAVKTLNVTGAVCRFACLVCRHRPVFDTISSLTVHRGGRKHATRKLACF